MLWKDDISGAFRINAVALPAGLIFALASLFLLSSTLTGQNNGASNHPTAPAPSTRPAPNAKEVTRSRIVELADMSGTVTFNRPGEAKGNPAQVSLPIEEGFRLSSLGESWASIAFEDDSTTIVGPRSLVVFHQLQLDANGGRLTGITMRGGVATFHLRPRHLVRSPGSPGGENGNPLGTSLGADAYEVRIAEVKVSPVGKARFRIDVRGGYVRLEALGGKVRFATPVESVVLSPGRSLLHRLGETETAFQIHPGIKKDAWDGFASLEEQKVFNMPKDKKVHQPEDVDSLLRSSRIAPSTQGAAPLIPYPPASHPQRD